MFKNEIAGGQSLPLYSMERNSYFQNELTLQIMCGLSLGLVIKMDEVNCSLFQFADVEEAWGWFPIAWASLTEG